MRLASVLDWVAFGETIIEMVVKGAKLRPAKELLLGLLPHLTICPEFCLCRADITRRSPTPTLSLLAREVRHHRCGEQRIKYRDRLKYFS